MNIDWITSFEALKSVYMDEAYSNIAVNEAVRRHHGCQESFVRNMVKGTVRDTLLLDYIIDDLAVSGVTRIKKRTLIVLRMGLHAIRSLDSVPDHAAVSESVTLARTVAKGTDRFVNAVLRSYLRERDEIESTLFLADRMSFPPGVARLLDDQYGDEADAIMRALNSPPPVVLRVNTLKTTRDELARLLSAEDIHTRKADVSERALIAEGSGIVASDLFRRGYFSLQSLSSITAIEALAPEPGSRILDMCAAPGGKTSMMAEMTSGTSEITACDIHPHRLELIGSTASRLGIGCIETRLSDGTEYDEELEGSFDIVLADVPCSGLGVIGSKPEIRLRTDPDGYGELREIQKKILLNAVRYARPGGRIEYSTCTLNRDENERLVHEALDSYGSVRFVEMQTILPYNDMVGFYYCILEKSVQD